MVQLPLKTRKRSTPNSAKSAVRSACSDLAEPGESNEGGRLAALVHYPRLLLIRDKADRLNRIERPDRTPHLAERQSREIGAGRARSLNEHDPSGDRLEGGAKMPLPFQPQHPVPGRLDAVAAEHIEIDGGLRPRRDQNLDRWRRGPLGRGQWTSHRFAQQ